MDGAARLLEGSGFDDISAMNDLIRACSSAASRCSRCCARRSTSRPSTCGSGTENQAPELRSASVVAANYGLGHRTLGAVSVIGPVRMDYRRAIRSVRAAARALSGVRRGGLRVIAAALETV